MVAIGYDYSIGAGDPYFGSFILPEIGDDSFELWLWSESISDYIFETLVGADSEYLFAAGGVDRFRVLGIETSAGLDPSDPTAFITGLSFVSDGRFTGTMTPIVEDVAAVPLPATLPLTLAGLAGLHWASRRRRSTDRLAVITR